jgi:hypothetical protein
VNGTHQRIKPQSKFILIVLRRIVNNVIHASIILFVIGRYMACHLDLKSTKNTPWTITAEVSNAKVLPIMSASYEAAGSYSMTYDTKCKGKTCKVQDSVLKSLNKGGASSVKTIDGYCNFHTHPFPCYDGEKTIWGWPSGEDMRECVGFALRGNLVHMVYTLEGIYTIQVNPNLLDTLSDDKKIGECMPGLTVPLGVKRGVIVSLIESYFRSTHGHRTKKYNTKFGKDSKVGKCGVCRPDDWVNYANKFTLGNMNTTGANKCSVLLPCNNFPEYTTTKSGTINLEKFLKQYGVEIYNMGKKGNITEIKKDNKQEIIHKYLVGKFESISEFFETLPLGLSYGGEKWSPGQWFHTKIFYNEFLGKNGTYVDINKHLDSMCPASSKKICDSIFDFWEKCSEYKSIRFTDVTIPFKPFKPTGSKSSCSISSGPQLRM